MPLAGKKLLFIFHNSGLTGASIVLLRYVEFLKKTEAKVSLVFLIPGKGKIESRLSKIGSVEYYAIREKLSFGNRVKRKLGLKVEQPRRAAKVTSLAAHHQPDLIYCNTIACSEFVVSLKKYVNAPLIWHIHELKTGVELLHIDPVEGMRMADVVLANSPVTAGFIQAVFGIPDDKMAMVYPSLPQHSNVKYANQEVITIGSSGTALPTKGPLAFIELAAQMSAMMPDNDYIFRWVGNYSKHKDEIDSEIARRGLQNVVLFTGETDDAMEEYRRFTVFVSLSQEESFGLALVEAGSLGVPVAAFEGAGEVSVLVKHCNGILVPFNHITDMARELTQLVGSHKQLEERGEAAKKHCRTYFDELVVPDWIRLLSETIAEIKPA